MQNSSQHLEKYNKVEESVEEMKTIKITSKDTCTSDGMNRSKSVSPHTPRFNLTQDQNINEENDVQSSSDPIELRVDLN